MDSLLLFSYISSVSPAFTVSPKTLPFRLWFLCIVAVLVLLVESSLVPHMNIADPAYQNWDCRRYVAAASNPESSLAHEGPYCWRLLVPTLVRALPLSPDKGFYVLTFLSLLCATILLFLYSNSQGLYTGETIAVLTFFLFSRWTTGYLLFDFALVDATAFSFILLILWLTDIRAKPPLVLAAIALGCLVKEQILAAAIYASVKYVRESKTGFKGLFVAALPFTTGLVVLALVRTLVPSSNNYSLLSEVVGRFTSTNPPGYFHLSTQEYGIFAYDTTFSTWGAVLPLVLVGFWTHRQHLRETPEKTVFLLLVFAQLLVARNVERLLIYAFPVCFILAATNVWTASPTKTKFFQVCLWGTVILQFLLYVRFILNVHGFEIRSLRETLVRLLS